MPPGAGSSSLSGPCMPRGLPARGSHECPPASSYWTLGLLQAEVERQAFDGHGAVDRRDHLDAEAELARVEQIQRAS